MGKFVIKPSGDQVYFVLKSSNGEPIGHSERYTTLSACKNGIESVRKNAPVANVEDQTVENPETQKHPKFELYEDKGGSPRFRLKATNGEIILASEAYSSKSACENGIESVRKNAVDSEVVEEKE